VVTRATAARYGAPLAFLAAVTSGVLLVRAGLDDSSQSEVAPPPPAATRPSESGGREVRARFYRIKPGDTLAGIAPRFGLTEVELVALNRGIEPTALHIGQKIRVR
jgi:hypothetical protein